MLQGRQIISVQFEEDLRSQLNPEEHLMECSEQASKWVNIISPGIPFILDDSAPH